MRKIDGIICWRKTVFMVLPVLFAMFSGCSRDVQTTKVRDVNFDQYQTYAWLPSGDSADLFNQNQGVAFEIRNKINNELQSQGYRIDTENPDFLVLVHTRYNEETELRTVPSGYGYYGPGFYFGRPYDFYYPYYGSFGYIGGGYVEPVQYTVGAMVIDIIDTERKEIVWRGTATDEVYGRGEREEIMEEMVENVEEIFEDFPEEKG